MTLRACIQGSGLRLWNAEWCAFQIRRLFFFFVVLRERSKQNDWLDVVVPESLRCLSNGDKWFCLCGLCAFSRY